MNNFQVSTHVHRFHKVKEHYPNDPTKSTGVYLDMGGYSQIFVTANRENIDHLRKAIEILEEICSK